MIHTCAIAAAYAFTCCIGIFGNTWVAISVIRSRKPRSTMGLSPADRLRSYIGLLAIVDLLVIASLFIRFVHVVLPDVTIESISCQVIYTVDQLVKIASLTCLMCISFERYLTIAKPFNNTVRKRLIRFTPLFAIFIIVIVFGAVLSLATKLTTMNDKKDCSFSKEFSFFYIICRWLIAGIFIFQLFSLCFFYGKIARHLRKKFWQRKARICTNPRLKQPLVQQPKYMKDTTNVILKIATFHFVCWLPYCLIQLFPESMGELSIIFTVKVRSITSTGNILQWIAFGAGLLAYLNSALDWIFYAVMNRDLRTIIRETTERRKRSTMSQSSPSAIHQSLRRQISQSIRFFYSINSYRSACNSFDESFNSQIKPELKNKLSGSIGGGSTGVLTDEHKYQTQGFIPAIRTGRAHTFSSPRTSLMSQDSRTSLHTSKFVAIAAVKNNDSFRTNSIEKFV